jgi:hypothetical protein
LLDRGTETKRSSGPIGQRKVVRAFVCDVKVKATIQPLMRLPVAAFATRLHWAPARTQGVQAAFGCEEA